LNKHIFSSQTNATFEIRKYEQLITNLFYATSQNLMDINKDTTLSHAFEHLRIYFKEYIDFANMLQEANKIYVELRYTVNGEKNSLRPKVLTAQLSVLTSFLYVKLMAELKPVDHVEKHRLKAQYIEEDLQMFEMLLGAYYIHGIVHGNITEYRNMTNRNVTLKHLKEADKDLFRVHPHCHVLSELREKTAEKIHKYASGNVYRPTEPTYDSFAKVCCIHRLSINKPTKRVKERSASDGHCQCEKEMDEH
jgi:hypothetical protein